MIWLLSFVLISLVVAGLAIGVLFSGKPLKGSCGGLNKFDPGAGAICVAQISKSARN